MGKFMDKLAGVLGFGASPAEDYVDEYDEYDTYEDDDEYDEYDDLEELEDYDEPRRERAGVFRALSSSKTPQGSDRERQSFFRGSSEADTYAASRTSRAASYTPRTTSFRPSARGNKVVNLHANVQMEVVVASPESFDEARDIALHIRDKKPVVINLEFVEHKTAQRITDFLCGCCCAMDGNIQRIADKIFMIAPDNVDFAGDVAIRETLEQQGGLAFPWGVDRR